MHNNIMAAGLKDRPPMLGPGRYSQWRSCFLRYIDTKPNGGGLKKSILSGPYVQPRVQVQADVSEANEMWIAIERLQQGESLNVQDVKTNLFWEFGKFTSRDGESMESYYSRFYKLMNELTRNNLQVTTMQVNVQFLQQLQPEMFQLGDNYYQAPKPQRSNATSSSTRPSASTRHKGKEIAKPITPQSESVSVSDEDKWCNILGITVLNCKGYGHYAKEAGTKAEDTDERLMNRKLKPIKATWQRLGGLTLKNPILLVIPLEQDDSNVTPDHQIYVIMKSQVTKMLQNVVDELLRC
ncbi:hypothetical protein Tco_0717586 [Tanacetum coccineum]